MQKILATALLASSMSVMAAENIKTVCSHGTETRVIEVVYQGEAAVPCEVRYSKSDGSKTLWSAENATGYCEEKAAAFVEKQKGWGWACEAAAVADNSDESEIKAEPDQVEEETSQEPVANAE